MSFQIFRNLFRSFGQDGTASGPMASSPAESESSHSQREVLVQLIHLPVRDVALYERALSHRSIVRGTTDSHLVSNERLEFLGDAVLGFIVAEDLHRRFPDSDEGFLTRLRAKLVNGPALARAAEGIGLGGHVRMSENMEQSGGRGNPTILADAFEATIGAVYLDLGLEAAHVFIRRAMLDRIDLSDLAARRDNFKSLLLEYAQAKSWSQPIYQVVSEEGPSHEKTFTIEVLVEGKPYGLGIASSKKQAEQQAARQALAELQSPKADSEPEVEPDMENP